MSEKCTECKKEIVGWDAGMISFEHDRQNFSVFKMGSQCKECAQKEAVQRFEEQKDKLTPNNKINWEYFNKLRGEKQTEAILILTQIRVLSPESIGRWEITSSIGGILNLLSPAGRVLYFSRLKDAVDFARSNYTGLYHWGYRQIGNYIPHQS